MSVKLLTEHHLEFLSFKGGYTGSSESTHVKMPDCWKSHVTAHFLEFICPKLYTISSIFHTELQTLPFFAHILFEGQFCFDFHCKLIYEPADSRTVLPAKSDSDVLFCLQSYQDIRIDRSLVY